MESKVRGLQRATLAVMVAMLLVVPWVALADDSDTTPPVITPNVSGTQGNEGWYVSDVTVSWAVVDGDSEITSTSGCGFTTIDSDTDGLTLTCTATSAGGTSSESVTIKRDATPPTFTWVGDINDGDEFYYGSVPSSPTVYAEDALSGLAYPWSWGGYGNSAGPHTMSAQARDKAGNVATESRTYTVLSWWTLAGFYAPVSSDPSVWNSAKGGSTVQLKFNVYAGATEMTSTSDIGLWELRCVRCDSGELGEPVDFAATGGTSLRYDESAGRFIQNWKTPKGAGCYVVTVATRDGSTLSANFRLK